jgi:hypothetical protein
MSQPIELIVKKFSKKCGFSYSTRDGIHLLTISKGNSLLMEIAIIPDRPEWKVSVSNRNNNEWLVSEFYDYIPAKELIPQEAKLEIQEAADDLNGFLERLSTSEVQVRERNTFFAKYRVFETIDNGEWHVEFNNALAKWNNSEKIQSVYINSRALHNNRLKPLTKLFSFF